MMRERTSHTARSTRGDRRPSAAQPAGSRLPAQACTRSSGEEHLVERGTYRGVEVLDAAPEQTSLAPAPRADRCFLVDYVIGAHLAPGYVGATRLLAPWAAGEDLAGDTSVRRIEVDEPAGAGQVAELVFEVDYLQRHSELSARARRLVARGVRRVFAVLVEEDRVEEWSRSAQAWQPLDTWGYIEDACLRVSLPVQALLDVEAADEAVARALIARGHPLLVAFGEACYRRGLAHGHQHGKAEHTP